MLVAKTAVLWCGVVCSLLTLVSGCGSSDLGSPTTASGKVTVDEQPLVGATVTFHCTGERAAEYRTFRSTTDSSGQYAIDEIYPGSYDVMVDEAAAGGQDVDPGAAPAAGVEPLRPADGTPLKAEVGEEEFAFDIKLTRSRR